MSVGVSSGYPQYGGGTSGLIPQLYADQFNVEYWATTLMPRITTGRFYEGLLNQGDKVTIPTEPTITVSDYVKGQELDIEVPTSTPITMTVDQAKYFNIAIDDIDKKQTHLQLADKYVDIGVRQMAQDIETEFFLDIVSDAHASNRGSAAGAVSGNFNLGLASGGGGYGATVSTVINLVTGVRSVLAEQNAFVPGKIWMVIPVWFRYLLMNSSLNQAYLTGDPKSTLRTGRIGEIDGITLYESNLLPTVSDGTRTCHYMFAGNMDAISYISQLNNSETLRSEKTFATLFRALQVYDWKVRKPEGLVEMVAYDATT